MANGLMGKIVQLTDETGLDDAGTPTLSHSLNLLFIQSFNHSVISQDISWKRLRGPRRTGW